MLGEVGPILLFMALRAGKNLFEEITNESLYAESYSVLPPTSTPPYKNYQDRVLPNTQETTTTTKPVSPPPPPPPPPPLVRDGVYRGNYNPNVKQKTYGGWWSQPEPDVLNEVMQEAVDAHKRGEL